MGFHAKLDSWVWFWHTSWMNSQDNHSKPPQAIVFWVIWFAILQGLIILQFFIGGGISKGSDQGAPPVWVLALAGGMALGALGIRFRVIPRITAVAQKLPMMIVGLALSEGIGLLGMFAVGEEFPATQRVFFGLAICCIICFAPRYATAPTDLGRMSA